MKRQLCRLALISSVLGALCACAFVVRTDLRLRARKESNRLVERAQELACRGDRSGSRQLVDQALAADPRNPRVYRELAMQLAAEGQREQAVVELTRAATVERTDAGTARECAALLWETGDKQGALRWLREAVRLEPDNGIAYAELAQCLLEIKDVAGGLRAAEQAVAVSPRVQAAHRALALARWRSGDLIGARAALEQALLLRPTDLSALLGAAQLSGELALRDSAVEYARRAVTAHPQAADAWLVLAQALAAAGRMAEADNALGRGRSLRSARPRRNAAGAS